MRISTLQAFNNGVAGLQRNYANVTRTQEQISTGNRILTPADDPVASVRLLQLEQQQNVLNQYAENLTAAKNSLTQEEVSLNSANTILQRVRELAVQAGNGALSSKDRASIAAELQEREDELLGVMNTRNARGEYLFAGFQGKTQPFVRQADGSYAYQGDEGQRKIQIASSLDIPISDNGKKTFVNITDAGRLQLAPPGAPGLPGLRVSTPLVQDEVAFSGTPAFPPGGIEIEFDTVNPQNYEIRSIAPPAVLGSGTLDSDPAKQDKLVFRGVVVNFDGTPAGGELVQITPRQVGGVDVQKQGVLDSIATLRQALLDAPDTPNGNLQVRDAVALGLTNLDHAMVTLDGVRGEIGARLNIVETTQTDNEDVSLVNKSVQAQLRELDYAEALSRLSFESIVLEAAQQSYVKIAGLTLFSQM
ncbi:flagellar hook-associated protein 3 [Pseudomonas fluvialis]|uniref:Flagellar hook-associated protein FlgL n=1 Tax=Pseudomonas fluvialis TaxID=1793966 RepID=A0ABQ2ARP8_9PSED|nr:flagellar hook-associated protein FlgL [Pseudomonas fluvialis]OXM40705.1 flagellar hook-associated protein 3 [Pseudomonas fluvialis]GGH94510.1 flagellar hook-associated protein FlgL [Pseudomonas fluvialis]